jgi:hypothetical protein
MQCARQDCRGLLPCHHGDGAGILDMLPDQEAGVVGQGGGLSFC